MKYLISVSIGPVQGFIAAARRTADLEAGSSLLCEAASLVSRTLDNLGGRLIFPPDPEHTSSNKILAQIDTDPRSVARQLDESLHKWLEGEWSRLERGLTPAMLSLLDRDLARSQIQQFLEYYAAWYPLTDDYQESRRNVEMLLAGRKALRDFKPPTSTAGRPKSSLDPSRDCVLKTGRDLKVPAAFQEAPFWLKPRETLDALSLLKRFRNRRGVPSTAEMAVRAILPRIEAGDPQIIRNIKSLAERFPKVIDLGDLFFWERLEEECAESPDIHEVKDLVKKALKVADCEAVPSYYAVLRGDGDHIGRIISAQTSLESHQHLSRVLAGAADTAKQVVLSFNGFPIYSRGDDIFCLLPVNTAIECAKSIKETYEALLEPFDPGASISMGLAICHYLEPLQSSIDMAGECLNKAKELRDSICLGYYPRGGGATELCLRWERAGDIQEWIMAFRQGLSRGIPYEISRLALEWKGIQSGTHTTLADLLQSEVDRIVQKKRSTVRPKVPEWVKDGKSLETLGNLATMARAMSQFPEASVINT
ncbi:MAG: type III-B CRISPR-associated protein Cas10/Cmr2 [Bacillota bacterium]